MMSNSERAAVLHELLRVHGGDGWESSGDAAFARETRRPYGTLRLVVEVRLDGDVDIHFHVDDHEPGWLEAQYVVPDGYEREAMEEVARFVGRFLREDIVLVYPKGLWSGGRRFVSADHVEALERRRIAWIVSWNGTHDWERPASTA